MTSIFKQAASHSLGAVYRVNSVENIEARIKAEVWKKHIRIKTFFEDYDKLRKGHCIEDKFISGLASALSFLNLSLTNDQIKNLADKYRIQPGDLIKYSDFISSIDSQFANTDFAKTNLQTLKQNSSFEDANKTELETLNQLLNYIKWTISSKRIFLKNPLKDYDRTNSNLVTREQFIRVLDNLNLVRNEELVDLLCRKYARSNNPKEICYLDFIHDVQNVNEVESYVVKGVVPNEKKVDKYSNVVKDIHNDSLTQQFYVQKYLPEKLAPIEDILKRIQAEVTLKRIRIKQFFLDFDGLRKNVVTGSQFKRVLATLNLSLTDNEFKQILKIYRVDEEGSRQERIKWMDFCQDVDLVFTKKGLDKDPLYKVSQITKAVFQPVKHISIVFTPQEEAALNELLNNYQLTISNKRVHLKPLFEDFDITKIGYVTKNQFTRILKQFDLIPKNQDLFNLLLKKYMDNRNLDEVNYYSFIRDVDKYNEVGQKLSLAHTDNFKEFEKKPRSNKATIRHEVPEDLSDLMGRIRKIVKERRIRVSQFMKDYDKLRHGNITKDQFRLSLNMAKIPLSEAEFKLILQHFETENKQNYVDWKSFCDNLDEVFNLKQLEKVPPNTQVQLAKTNFNYGKSAISEQELAIANRIKQAFKEHQLVNRLDTKQLFQNWDKLNRFKVSPKQFRQVLATIGFNLTEQQNRAICKLYASDDENEKQVKYLQFLKDTKPFDFSYMTAVKDEVRRGTGQSKPIPNNIEDILFELRKITKLNRLRYRQYFKDFDPLNKGTIKKNKYKSVIYQTMKVALDERLFLFLEKHYEDQSDKTLINYQRFCQDIDIVFNLPDKEKEPTLRPANFDYTVTHLKKDQQNIDSLMRRLGQVTRKHRILLKPFFQDKDMAKIGRVSFTRMRSILDNNKIPLTDSQFTLLCKNFSYEGIEFNYVDFIEALKQYEGNDE